jgi:hypothetical protein
MKLPLFVFVCRKSDNDGSTWLHATTDTTELLEDDGSTQVIGTYKRLKTNRWKLQPVLVEPKPRKRK